MFQPSTGSSPGTNIYFLFPKNDPCRLKELLEQNKHLPGGHHRVDVKEHPVLGGVFHKSYLSSKAGVSNTNWSAGRIQAISESAGRIC